MNQRYSSLILNRGPRIICSEPTCTGRCPRDRRACAGGRSGGRPSPPGRAGWGPAGCPAGSSTWEGCARLRPAPGWSALKLQIPERVSRISTNRHFVGMFHSEDHQDRDLSANNWFMSRDVNDYRLNRPGQDLWSTIFKNMVDHRGCVIFFRRNNHIT